jgi:integrase
VENDLDLRNVFQGLKIKGAGSSKTDRLPVTDEQLATLLPVYATSPVPEALFVTLTDTGARLAEIVGLEAQDLDLAKGCLNIRHNSIRRLKTKTSDRVIPLSRRAQELLRPQQDGLSDTSPIFPQYARPRGSDAASAMLMKRLRTQVNNWGQLQHFLDWCVQSGELEANPWEGLTVKAKPKVNPHGVLTDAQVVQLLNRKDWILHNILLFCLLTGLRSGEACGLLAEDVVSKGNLGRFVRVAPNDIRQLKSRAAQREVPLHSILENLLDTSLPATGRLFPTMTVDKVVKRYAFLRRQLPELQGTVFHSTRKWFITQCERTGTPEHFTASIVGHQSARSENKLTYGLYSAGISDEQKRQIVEGVTAAVKR